MLFVIVCICLLKFCFNFDWTINSRGYCCRCCCCFFCRHFDDFFFVIMFIFSSSGRQIGHFAKASYIGWGEKGDGWFSDKHHIPIDTIQMICYTFLVLFFLNFRLIFSLSLSLSLHSDDLKSYQSNYEPIIFRAPTQTIQVDFCSILWANSAVWCSFIRWRRSAVHSCIIYHWTLQQLQTHTHTHTRSIARLHLVGWGEGNNFELCWASV